MKIHQIIRKKRKELSLTQEQVANYLGVSTPAVNKWEKGITCPDITILPALARLLKTDLNTLLSFQEDLTDIEITNFVSSLDKIIQEQDYETAFQIAVEKIQEYPTCETLLCSAALFLEGALFLYHVPEREPYREKLEDFYRRMSESDSPEIKDTGISMLISYHRNRGDFEKAEELIKALPVSTIDAQEHLATLYTFQENYEEAQKLWARRILDGATKIQTALMHMMDIALKENRYDDAAFFADKYESVSRQCELPKWMSYNAHLQLAVERQEKENCFRILKEMLPAMKEKGDLCLQDSCLYQSLCGSGASFFSTKLADTICDDIINREEFAFLREDAEFDCFRRQFIL